MSQPSARKVTPKSSTPTTLNKRQQAALKRVVARVLADASDAIGEIVETAAQEALVCASGEDAPDYQAHAEGAVLLLSEMLPVTLRKAGKELVTPAYVRSVISGFE